MTAIDREHLRLLSIFHYVIAGLFALYGCFPIIHFLIGTAMVFAPDTMTGNQGDGMPRFMGVFFMVFGGGMVLIAWSIAICTFVAARSLAQRKNYMFCLVVAGVEAATCMPIGTILGVFTFVVLFRPAVKQAFVSPVPPVPTAPSP